MLSETLSSELARYRIGPRIRALRLGKKMGLVQLGAHTGLSPAMLSKIERGQLFPTLPTLLRIALVFGIALDHFFAREGPRVAVTRHGERLQLPAGAEANSPAYLFESLDYPLAGRRMDAFLAHFPAGAAPSDPHQHSGAEFIYVLEGRLFVTVDAEETRLEAGDAMHFEADAPHYYRGEGACQALVVTVP